MVQHALVLPVILTNVHYNHEEERGYFLNFEFDAVPEIARRIHWDEFPKIAVGQFTADESGAYFEFGFDQIEFVAGDETMHNGYCFLITEHFELVDTIYKAWTRSTCPKLEFVIKEGLETHNNQEVN